MVCAPVNCLRVRQSCFVATLTFNGSSASLGFTLSEAAFGRLHPEHSNA
jgi:hypothetical protein